jgi:hypothetical protein
LDEQVTGRRGKNQNSFANASGSFSPTPVKSIWTTVLALLALVLLFAGQPLQGDEAGALPQTGKVVGSWADADGANGPLWEATEYDFSSCCLSSQHENHLLADLPVEVLSKQAVVGSGCARPREPASIIHRRHYVYCSALLPRPPSR